MSVEPNTTVGGAEQDRPIWIGRGTWLVDRRHYRSTVGVVTGVSERGRGMGSRLSIQWRPNRYQNLSLLLALEHLKSGEWAVDTGSTPD